jgi:hypothetical protein
LAKYLNSKRVARPFGPGVVAGVLLLVAAGLASAIVHRDRDASNRRGDHSEVNASIERGVAWIWPDSNGPQGDPDAAAPPYLEAAVLSESLVLRAVGVEHGGRTQPLVLPEGVRLLPVVHVEAAADAPAVLTPSHRAAVVQAVRRQAGTAAAGAGALQLDFEAPPRQREAYVQLIGEIRKAMPANVRLSVTALAHWCVQGDWLDRLPVDEVVPMLYRLGPQAAQWRQRFAQPDDRLARRCRGPALGFATNEPPPPTLLARASRPYWFDESAWSNPSHPPFHLVR